MNRNSLVRLLFVATLLICPGGWAQSGTGELFSGMVWERHGEWHLNGGPQPLRLGEAIAPGGIITAGSEGAAHSLIILLPDGERLLCECFDAKECAQGFRVPAITPPPSPAVWDMFVAVRNVLLLRAATSETAFPALDGRAAMARNAEIVAVVDPQGQISIAPALRVLPSGQYTVSVSREGTAVAGSTKALAQPFSWTAGQTTAPVRVEGTGLYRVRVIDQGYVTRIDIEVLATSAAATVAETNGLKQARDTVLSWSGTRAGWPVHSFLRIYLEARLGFLSH